MLHIDTVGERRFQVLRLHHDRPYLWCDAEPIADGEPGEAPRELIERVRNDLLRVHRLRASAAGGFEREPWVPHEPGPLADAIGALSEASPQTLQALLETLDSEVRLQAAAPLLEGLLAVSAQAAESAAAIRWKSLGRAN
jgi:Lon protease-like protein